MNQKSIDLVNNGLDLLTGEYRTLALYLLLENLSFRMISFTWMLLLAFIAAPSRNFIYGVAIVSVTILVLWVSTTAKMQKSRKRLEVALIQYSAERGGILEKIYVEWQYEKIHPLTKFLSGAEPYIWAIATAILFTFKAYL